MVDIVDPFETTTSAPSSGGIVDPFDTSTKTEKAGPASQIGHQALSAVTDIPSEIANEATQGWKGFSENRMSPFHPIETAKAVTGAAQAAFSPGLGTIKSVLGHSMTAAEIAAGEYVANPILRAVGIPEEKIQHPDPDKMYENSKQDVEKALSAVPAARVVPRITPPPIPPQEPFGVTRSLGEITGDLPTRQFEQGALRNQHGEPAQQQANEFFNVQRPEQLAAAKESVLRQLDPTGSQLIVENPAEAANIAQQSLQTEAARTKAQVTAAYDRAKNAGGELHTDVFTDLPQNLKGDLWNRPERVVVDDNTPVASRMLNYLDREVGELNITNRAMPQSTGLVAPGPAPKVGVSLEGVEQWRKNLSRMRGEALGAAHTNPSDYRAADAVMHAFDARINGAVNDPQLFTGSRAAVDAWNDARAMAAQRFRTWGNDPIGKQLQKIIGNPQQARDPLSLNKVADALYGAQGTSPGEAQIGMARRVRQILGEDSPEWAAIRQGLVHRLISVAEGNNERGVGTVATRLNEFLNGRGSDMAEIMLTSAQRSMLQQYATLHRQLQVPQLGANWPNTAGGIIPHVKEVGRKIMGAIGATIGHFIGPPIVGEAVGYGMGKAAGALGDRASNARSLAQARRQMPLVGQAYNAWQRATAQAYSRASIANANRVALTTTNLANALSKIGIDHTSALRMLQQAGPSGPGESEAKGRAEGGRVGDDYNTQLGPADEMAYQAWKMIHAPNDSGADYDLRGAYQSDMQRDPVNDHMGDRFKKPNHPTFSDQSQYAVGDQRDRAGHWVGPEGPDQIFVPPANKADGGEVSDDPQPTTTMADYAAHPERGYKMPASELANQAGASLATQKERLPAPTDDSTINQKMMPDISDDYRSGILKALTEPNSFSRGTEAWEEDLRSKRLEKNKHEMPDVGEPTVSDGGQFSKGTEFGNKLFGTGEQREQTWPERMVRSGATLAHDVYTGEEPLLQPGLRREDYTDKPVPSGLTVAAQPNDEAYTRAQDMAGLAGSGGLGGVGEGAGVALGTSPMLRPALKYNGKVYKAPPGGEHADAMPPELYDTYQKQALSGEDVSNFDFGFMNHKGQFLSREDALKYGIDNGLVNPQAAKQGALTTPILSDSSVTGAPLAALEHAQPFYSAVEKTVQSAPQSKMHGEQWANWLKNQPGVKPDEMQYTGLDKWLREQKGPVTKEQVADFVDKNKVELQDVTKGGPAPFDSLTPQQRRVLEREYEEDFGEEPDPNSLRKYYYEYRGEATLSTIKYSSYQLPGGENYREHLITLPEKLNLTEEGLPKDYKLVDENAEARAGGFKFPPNTPERWSYSGPGVYSQVFKTREAAIADALRYAKQNEHTGAYRSSHWDEPNILAHVRTNDRDVGGVPSLHLEELQSDWHQSGRKKGYREEVPEEKRKVVAERDRDSRNTFDEALEDAYKNHFGRDIEGLVRYRDKVIEDQGKIDNLPSWTNTPAVREAASNYVQHRNEAVAVDKLKSGVPDAPFKTSWPELAMKRMIQKAAIENKSRISWTPGEAQAARYDLSKHLKEIRVVEHEDAGGYTWWPVDKNGTQIGSITTDASGNVTKANSIWGDVVGKPISDVVGKDVAENGMTTKGEKTLSNIDLKVGGESKKVLYDQIMPKLVEKLGKQYGVKVKQAGIEGAEKLRTPKQVYDVLAEKDPTIKEQYPTIAKFVDHWNNLNSEHRADLTYTAEQHVRSPVFYFDIPPKMKEDVLKKGFPLFSDTVHGGLLNQNAKKNEEDINWPEQKEKTEPEIKVPERASGGRVVLSNMEHSPSEAQKHAGNYAKEHIRAHGLDFAVENAKGKERSGIGKDGKRWAVKMPAHYGYIKNSVGADKDHVDVYFGPHIRSDKVFVINQIDADTKQFDEHKIMLGFRDLKHALETYEKGFSDGKGLQRVGSIVPTDVACLKQWLKSANTKKPFVLNKEFV